MDQADTVGRMAEAASNFLAGLDAKGQQQAVIDFADTVERENWHYIPRDRAGLPLKEMDEKIQSQYKSSKSDLSRLVFEEYQKNDIQLRCEIQTTTIKRVKAKLLTKL